jgi:Tol biopolymer transport system component
MRAFAIFLLLIIIGGCGKKSDPTPDGPTFSAPEKVTVAGYSGDVMEPFLSRDGSILLFNNSNNASVNTNLHWAIRVNDLNFEYKGELNGVNTSDLEAVPTLDQNGKLYFVSTRSYQQTYSSVYSADLSGGAGTNVALVDGVSKNQVGWVNFDIEVNATGETLYFTDGRFDLAGGPYEADIGMAIKNGGAFQRQAGSGILKNINSPDLEYAACISPDNLELYFTKVKVPFSSSSQAEIFLSGRKSPADLFENPVKIAVITGFAEAPTISPDGKIIYYHVKENDRFGLYLIRRTR